LEEAGVFSPCAAAGSDSPRSACAIPPYRSWSAPLW